MTNFNIVLFDDFETLDAFGPAEVIGNLPEEYSLNYHSLNGGAVVSSQKVSVNTRPFSKMEASGVLFIPGGAGVRTLVNDGNFIEQLKALSVKAPCVLTVCTGSVLLAKTGLLDGLSATSYKAAFEWVNSTNDKVNWVKKARWVKNGKFYTSSGVSAGMDMILGFVSDKHGINKAQEIAHDIEYVWNRDMDDDPFAFD